MTTASTTTSKDAKSTAPKKTALRGESKFKDDIRGYSEEAAYYKAESRCFEPSSELDDWLEGEIELISSAMRIGFGSAC